MQGQRQWPARAGVGGLRKPPESASATYNRARGSSRWLLHPDPLLMGLDHHQVGPILPRISGTSLVLLLHWRWICNTGGFYRQFYPALPIEPDSDKQRNRSHPMRLALQSRWDPAPPPTEPDRQINWYRLSYQLIRLLPRWSRTTKNDRVGLLMGPAHHQLIWQGHLVPAPPPMEPDYQNK